MRNVSELHTRRALLGRGLGLMGLFTLAGGCGDGGDPNAKPQAPPTTAEQQAKEREAREKAFGKQAIPHEKAK